MRLPEAMSLFIRRTIKSGDHCREIGIVFLVVCESNVGVYGEEIM
jgi:hypothetical protein